MVLTVTPADNALFHHGIDGMKWGVRNGPPYPLERKKTRLMKKEEKTKEQNKKSLAESLSGKEKARLVLQKSDDMSTEELKKALERIKVEEEIKAFDPKYINKGKKEADGILKDSAKKILTTVLVGAGTYATAKIIGYYFGDSVEKFILKK